MFNLFAEVMEAETSIKSSTIETIENVSNHGGFELPDVSKIRNNRSTLEATNDEALNNWIDSEGLPTHYFNGCTNGDHYGDIEWIAKKLRRIVAIEERKTVAADYSKHYFEALNNCRNELKAAGIARFIANSWLLKRTK